ncbi:unnamed protein product [Dovyalis caffra]|uniref:Uncharacterized protein n=1 Tax=Dovyalis caffra TaxID=77055 RepID=A0AAV1RD66_9ROSI|nr:unnamed protein product [Dovyalis caffra]
MGIEEAPTTTSASHFVIARVRQRQTDQGIRNHGAKATREKRRAMLHLSACYGN